MTAARPTASSRRRRAEVGDDARAGAASDAARPVASTTPSTTPPTTPPTTVRRGGRQRAAVVGLLDDVQTFLSAQGIYARLREQGNPIGLATVYRALQTLVEDGEVDVLRGLSGREDAEAVYRKCSPRGPSGGATHHHLVCRRCGEAVEVEAGTLQQWAQQTGARHGFADVEQVTELFGTCSRCQRATRAPGGMADGVV